MNEEQPAQSTLLDNSEPDDYADFETGLELAKASHLLAQSMLSRARRSVRAMKKLPVSWGHIAPWNGDRHSQRERERELIERHFYERVPPEYGFTSDPHCRPVGSHCESDRQCCRGLCAKRASTDDRRCSRRPGFGR